MDEAPRRPRPLDELVLTVVVDNGTDTLSSVADGVPELPEVVGHVLRRAPVELPAGEEGVEVFGHLCVACHGFSVLATGRVGDEEHTVLFDAGPYGDVWVDNAERLGLDLAAVEAVFLSHWHWDHSGALPDAVGAISTARAAAGLDAPVVVDLHPDRPDQRGTGAPGRRMVLLPPEPTLAALESAGGRVENHAEAHLLAGGFFLGSGEIPRRTAYETGLPGHRTIRGGEVVDDPLILDERYLAAVVRGRGTTVLSACSHAGVVNACLAAAEATGEPIDLVLGGYHLAGAAMEPRIGDTVRDLRDLVAPTLVAPGHCTGWRAEVALADAFGASYAPSAVGARYTLSAVG
ncbi:MBL fold metallo-hydrolase [Actinomarinicola tropica]|uniref:MBL fold metallo-hydrolase n=1 Tax=Actinomarinicola tropica TaxID=2789776 RepID=A0A5Q2RMP0_9ACTN|nr:MBL fold metallo-hydrolase [Actinomarinicola tropica]QGG94455.1 MBL fold metallo-hydrolase [Actinomarinicola tropica]